MLDFTPSLALYDFLPVLFTALAMWLLADFVRRVEPSAHGLMLAGGALVVAGGLAKASWKLIVALSGLDLGWLAGALFPLMAPGFILAAIALTTAVSRLRGGSVALGWPPALSLLAILAVAVAVRELLLEIPRGWFLPLLIGTTLGNLVLTLQLIRAALHLRRALVVVLLVLNLGMVIALPPIAMAGPNTLWMHWLEQSLTAAGAGCFAAAAFLLRRRVADGPAPAPGGRRALT